MMQRKRSSFLTRVFLSAGLCGAVIAGVTYGASKNADALLQVAARDGVSIAVEPLILLGANPRAQKAEDDPLWQAALRGHAMTVKALLYHGADIHAGNDFALRVAAQHGRTDTVKLLVARGANVHAQNDWPLRMAASYGHAETVKALIAAGANIHAGNDQALRWARENGHADVVTLLRNHGVRQSNQVFSRLSLPG
jgi:ankyrin repeat protein